MPDQPTPPAPAEDEPDGSMPADTRVVAGTDVPGSEIAGPATQPDRRKRPLIERLGLAVIALGLAALFAVVAVAAFAGSEPFLGIMGAIGCLMVLWVGGLTLFRG